MSDGVKYHVCVSVVSEDENGFAPQPMNLVTLLDKDDYDDALAVAERIADLVDVLTEKGE